VRAIAGQVWEKAMRYYSHIRIEAKTEGVRRLETVTRKWPTRASQGQSGILASIKAVARRLEISTDTALELIFEYERSKAG